MSTVVSVIAFVLMLGLLIFVHEFGHFLLAKKNGVGVVEFAVGMGPDIVSWVKNGTKYAIKWIPFGGYCMMLGAESYVPEGESSFEDVVSDDEHAFMNKPVRARISVILAGPVFNFLLAFLLSFLLMALVGTTTSKIGAVSEGYPAESAGLQAGDVITKLNHTRVRLFKEISVYLTLHEGEEVKVTYLRDGERHETTLVPVYNEEEERYLIGIISSGTESGLSFLEVVRYGVRDVWYNTGIVFKSLGMLLTGKAGINDLSGPVGMAGMVNDIVTEVEEDTKGDGFFVTAYWVIINLMNFCLLITANLGVMNLLPIPGMDGGRLLFLFIEAVIGKPVPKKFEGVVTVAGFILLFLLMIFVLFNDIRKVFFM